MLSSQSYLPTYFLTYQVPGYLPDIIIIIATLTYQHITLPTFPSLDKNDNNNSSSSSSSSSSNNNNNNNNNNSIQE